MTHLINEISSRVYSRLGQAGSIFGMGLMEVMSESEDIYLLTADMGKPVGMTRFKNKYPDNFINVGIAEQNLIGIASGLASEGNLVVASAQAAFITMRSFEQMRQYLGYMNLPVVTVGISAGFGLTFFGNTHYAIEDIALMRTIPGMTILSPSDAGQAAKAIDAALKARSPVYIRCTGSLNCPVIYQAEYQFEIGRAIELKPGETVAIFGTGAVTSNAIEAANILEQHGISAAVIDVHTIKPLDIECLNRYIKYKLFVSVEEHSVVGGLGGAISEYLAGLSKHPPLIRLGTQDRFFAPGDYPYLIQQSRLDSVSISEDILDALLSS